MKKNLIFLIGFMGSGKSTIGRLLAKEFKYDFVDTDARIEEESKMKISDIFTKKGEGHFRKLEANLLKKLSNNSNLVVSTGGGMPIQNGNMELMNEKGSTIFLFVSLDIIFDRIKNDKNRPLILEKKKSDLQQLFDERRKHYKKAQFKVMASRNPANIVKRIKNLLEFDKTM